MEEWAQEDATERDDEPTFIRGGGARFGRFRLCFEIAAGGMATVYLARAEGPAGFEKLVALKRIHPHLARERDFVEMFLDEARIAARIGHPNVCSVLDFGQSDGTYWLTMEFLLGEPLSRVLRALAKRDGKIDPRLLAYTARVIADACEGLHAAHELRDETGKPLHVVHRDVSPQNIFVTYDGNVRIVDFGIASAADRVHRTATGTVKGKYAYMAPEQIRSKPVDRRADVWALGVCLWEMVAGRRLFRRSTQAESMFAAVSDPIPPLSSVRKGVPVELEAIVERALQRDPEKRYATARELGRDLTRFVATHGEPVSLADLGEWMEALFPEGRARKRQLLDIARQMDHGIPQVHDTGSDSVPDDQETRSHVRVTAVRRAATRAAILAGGGALLLSGLVFVLTLAFASGGSDPEPASPRVAAPMAAEPVRTAPPVPRQASGAQAGPETAATATATEAEAETATETEAEAATAAAVEAPRPDPPIATATKTERTARRPRATPRRETQHTAADRQTGAVNVVVSGGWAEVWWRGRRMGHAPTRLELPAGEQVIEVRGFGRAPGRRVTVDVRPGTLRRVSVDVSR